MVLNDVLDEIRSSRTSVGASAAEDPVQKKRTPKKEKTMTKAEREAYRARKMKEEEDRYLGKTPRKTRSRKAKSGTEQVPQKVRQDVELMYASPNPPREPKRPKMLEPLQPLYLLKIPGLPKGDCLAVCLVHGIES